MVDEMMLSESSLVKSSIGCTVCIMKHHM